jgi:inosine-uridine nucleoside N-ribohydrolase
MAERIIIDCDVGVDDALALILAFHSPELRVEAITGVNGNVPLNLVLENIKKVLELIQPPTRPRIAEGADRPLKGEPVYAFSFHGETGLGRATLELEGGAPAWQVSSLRADELITTMARRHPDELTLVALGPLTNLALALQKDPEGMKKLKSILIMGGAVRVKGNVTPHAEFNIFVDPTAARRVLESGLPITLVPLDVTQKVCLTSEVMEETIYPRNDRFSKFVFDVTQYDPAIHRFVMDRKIFHLHDPLAIAVAIRSELVETEKLSIDVDTREGDYFGRTREVEGEFPMEVCLKVRSEDFLQLFLSRLSPNVKI